jgi:hypothetical protein
MTIDATLKPATSVRPIQLSVCLPDCRCSVFEDATVADLLTTGKLSELACLTLYMMYEKKLGQQSRWYEYIKVRVAWLMRVCLGDLGAPMHRAVCCDVLFQGRSLVHMCALEA